MALKLQLLEWDPKFLEKYVSDVKLSKLHKFHFYLAFAVFSLGDVTACMANK